MKMTQLVLLALLAGGLGALAQTGIPPAAAAPQAAESITLSPGLNQLVGLAESGASQDSMLSFVNNYPQPFGTSADVLFYLRDQGISSTLIDAILNHDKTLASNPYTYSQKSYGNNPRATEPAPTASIPQPPPAPATTYQPAPEPVYVTDATEDVTYFYDQLRPYGTWINLAGYGWCWQPRAVVLDGGWRPYCDGGRWVYTDNGWCWKSDYSWGWAPFHYGRWNLQAGVGWVWFPDRTWGPGWVTWRNDNDHCGWAPLPYRSEFVAGLGYRYSGVGVGVNYDFGLGVDAFTFISINNFAARDYRHYRLEQRECREFFPRTSIRNNIEFDHARGFINRGFEKDRIESATHHNFQRVEIRNEERNEASHHSSPGSYIYRGGLVKPSEHLNARAQRIEGQNGHIQHEAIGNPRGNHFEPQQPQQQPQQQPNHPRLPGAAGFHTSSAIAAPSAPGNGTIRQSTASIQEAPQPNSPAQNHNGFQRPFHSDAPPAVRTPPQNESRRFAPVNNLVGVGGSPVSTYSPPNPYRHEYTPKSYPQTIQPAQPSIPQQFVPSHPVVPNFVHPQTAPAQPQPQNPTMHQGGERRDGQRDSH